MENGMLVIEPRKIALVLGAMVVAFTVIDFLSRAVRALERSADAAEQIADAAVSTFHLQRAVVARVAILGEDTESAE